MCKAHASPVEIRLLSSQSRTSCLASIRNCYLGKNLQCIHINQPVCPQTEKHHSPSRSTTSFCVCFACLRFFPSGRIIWDRILITKYLYICMPGCAPVRPCFHKHQLSRFDMVNIFFIALVVAVSKCSQPLHAAALECLLAGLMHN